METGETYRLKRIRIVKDRRMSRRKKKRETEREREEKREEKRVEVGVELVEKHEKKKR